MKKAIHALIFAGCAALASPASAEIEEARDLIFVFIGHEFEEIARDGFVENVRTLNGAGFRNGVREKRAISAGVILILIIGQKRRAMFN